MTIEKYINDFHPVVFLAKKVGKIAAHRGIPGEKVISWIVVNGAPVIERTGVCDEDSYVVTKLDSNGIPIEDEFGHLNQWIIPGDKFVQKYIAEGDVYVPISAPKHFVRVEEDMTIMTDTGEEMFAEAGGVINIDDSYSISARDFADTYRAL